ncbi:MAG: ABC transporter permease [Acidobacteriota bacterium]|jgi:ABC-2 type transport system permease protein
MKGTLSVAWKETLSYFFAPMAYIVITAFLVMNGLIFYIILTALSQPGSFSASPMALFFGGTLFFWIFLIIMVPAITMRLGAEEKKSGTLETLLTAPVTDSGVVAGKYLAAMAVYVAAWLPTLIYVLVLSRYSDVDPGPVAAGYLGVLLVGLFFTSVGLFTTMVSRNQLVAAIIAFTILIVLLCVPLLSFMVTDVAVKGVLQYLSLWNLMQNFAKGIVDTRALVYLLSGTALFLMLSYQALQTRRWA